MTHYSNKLPFYEYPDLFILLNSHGISDRFLFSKVFFFGLEIDLIGGKLKFQDVLSLRQHKRRK
jgi:hypothetical protein